MRRSNFVVCKTVACLVFSAKHAALVSLTVMGKNTGCHLGKQEVTNHRRKPTRHQSMFHTTGWTSQNLLAFMICTIRLPWCAAPGRPQPLFPALSGPHIISLDYLDQPQNCSLHLLENPTYFRNTFLSFKSTIIQTVAIILRKIRLL